MFIARHAVSQITLLIPHFFVKFSLLSVGIFSKCPPLPRIREIKFWPGHSPTNPASGNFCRSAYWQVRSLHIFNLTSTISVVISRWSQGWMRTDRWAIEAQTGITYIAVALLVTFHKLLFQPQAFPLSLYEKFCLHSLTKFVQSWTLNSYFCPVWTGD